MLSQYRQGVDIMKSLLDRYVNAFKAFDEATGRRLEGDWHDPEDAPLAAGLDAALVWSRESVHQVRLEPLFEALPINSLVWRRPVGPFAAAVAYEAQRALDIGVNSDTKSICITPRDSETRTFLHDIPVVPVGDVDALAAALRRRKGVVEWDDVRGPALVAVGSVSPAQGYVTISSMAFACFVMFFGRALPLRRRQAALVTDAAEASAEDAAAVARRLGDACYAEAFAAASARLRFMDSVSPPLAAGPFDEEETACAAMDEAGRAVVARGLVDSVFGNISYRVGRTMHISQTGAPLDELPGAIDPVDLDGRTCAGMTASSECSAHAAALEEDAAGESAPMRAVLHGHPRFAVTLSLDCAHGDADDCSGNGDGDASERCALRDRCHVACPRQREVGGVPVVTGEVGVGPTGLSTTLPPALRRHGAAVVLGHGVFTLGREDFRDAFACLEAVERAARVEYFTRLGLQPR